MNKTQKFFIVSFVLVVLGFLFGYKIGGSVGYSNGYEEGYRYDCKEEIGAIYKRVKSQSEIVRSLRAQSIRNQFENDSLKNNEKFKQRQVLREMYDEERDRRRAKYVRDSAEYLEDVFRYNDSLSSVLDGGYGNIVRADGSPNTELCGMLKLGIAECQSGWHISKVLTKEKRKKNRKNFCRDYRWALNSGFEMCKTLAEKGDNQWGDCSTFVERNLPAYCKIKRGKK